MWELLSVLFLMTTGGVAAFFGKQYFKLKEDSGREIVKLKQESSSKDNLVEENKKHEKRILELKEEKSKLKQSRDSETQLIEREKAT